MDYKANVLKYGSKYCSINGDNKILDIYIDCVDRMTNYCHIYVRVVSSNRMTHLSLEPIGEYRFLEDNLELSDIDIRLIIEYMILEDIEGKSNYEYIIDKYFEMNPHDPARLVPVSKEDSKLNIEDYEYYFNNNINGE